MSLKRLSVVMLLLSTGSLAIAQQTPRFEAGPIVACVSDCNDHPNWGWSARGTVNLTNVFGGEAQIFEHQANRSTVETVRDSQPIPVLVPTLYLCA